MLQTYTRGWSASTYVHGPKKKTVLIKNKKKPIPNFWKCAGGRSEANETPTETAQRELWEETGLLIPIGNLKLVEMTPKTNHDFYFFEAWTDNFNGLKKMGDEGEMVAIFDEDEIEGMVDFFPPYRPYLQKIGILAA